MAITVDKASIGGRVVEPVNTTVTFTTDQTVAANAFIVIPIVYWHNGTSAVISGVADNGAGGSKTYTVDVDVQSANGGGNPKVAIARAQAGAGGLASGTVITVTFSTSLVGSLAGVGGSSFLGVATSSELDAVSAIHDDAASATWVSNSRSILAGSLLYGNTFHFQADVRSTQSAGTEALDYGNAVGAGQVGSYRIESSAGSYTLGGTWASGTPNTCTVVAAYKVAASSAIEKTGTGLVGP